jgi:DME family drug/metabolite transporter
VLQYTAPVLVVAAGVVFARRRPGAPLLASLALAMAGVVLVTGALDGDIGGLDAIGLLAGLASAALFASYTVLGEYARRELEPPAVMLRAFALAAAFWVAFLATRGWPHELFEPEALPGVLFVGAGGTLAPFLLYVWAVAHVRAERAAIAATLEPVLAALAAWLWLGQALSAAQVIGGVLVIVAVVALQMRAG